MDLTRKCPNCQKEIVYKNKKNLTKAEKRNSKCHECKYDDNFKKKISETTKIAMWRPEIREKFLEENAKIDCSKQTKKYFQEYFKDENNKIKYRERCKKAYENMPEETKEKIKKASSKAHKGKAHTQEQRELISERMRGIKNPFYGKTHSEETKKILRDKTLKQMEINGGFFKYTPMFNRKACDFFDFLNKNLGWKGQHALTENGEYVVPNYFYYLDYYEPRSLV